MYMVHLPAGDPKMLSD